MTPRTINLQKVEALVEATKGRQLIALTSKITLPAGWRELAVSSDFGLWAFNPARELKVGVSDCIETDGKRWRHVSASKPKRVPNYEEMCLVKNVFVGEEVEGYSVWAPKSRHVNIHPFCLHIWVPLSGPVLPDFSCGGVGI